MSVRKERSKGLFEASKRRGILESTVKVMTRKGVEGFAMDEVVVEAGIAKGTLYYYFPSKENLVDSAIEATLSPLGEELDTLFSSAITPLKKIEYRGQTEIFMHPFPRGLPILETAEAITAEINRSRDYLEALLDDED